MVSRTQEWQKGALATPQQLLELSTCYNGWYKLEVDKLSATTTNSLIELSKLTQQIDTCFTTLEKRLDTLDALRRIHAPLFTSLSFYSTYITTATKKLIELGTSIQQLDTTLATLGNRLDKLDAEFNIIRRTINGG